MPGRASISRGDLPSSPGTYVLVLEATAARRVRVGALGRLEIEPGFYAYVGSARGPGGLAARLGRHLGRAPTRRWHIDYLRRHTALREIWLVQGADVREHAWAAALEAAPGAGIPLPRFGASDCRCRSHLFRFRKRPRVASFRRALQRHSTPSPAGPVVSMHPCSRIRSTGRSRTTG